MAKKGLHGQRLGTFVLTGTAVAMLAGLTALSLPAQAQFFDLFKPRPEVRPTPTAAAVDYSRAPPPARKAADAIPPSSTVVVLGDSLADWLAFGLEEALTDTEFGIVRKHRSNSGLIRYDFRNENQDWAQAAREIIAADKPNYIVMMVGLHDRQAIRERVAAPATTPARGARGAAAPAPAAAQPAQPAAPAPAAEPQRPATGEQQEADRPADAENPEQPAVATPEAAPRTRVAGTHEFRSEKWAELYGKRIDDTIAVLKSRGVPVLWVGLPSLRGPRSTGDVLYLNEMYRTRAEKAGIVFVDVWDGFVDEGGRYSPRGPDMEGQIRPLRAGDGVHFTRPGARKLAHYVDRELKRLASRGPIAVALPSSEPSQPQAPAAKPGGPMARPLSGPVMPLTATANQGEDGLLGGANARPASDHITVSRVLVKGEAVQSPAGRSDDFMWPRRAVADFGADPVVATTTLPLVVMQAPAPKTVLAPNADAPPPTTVAAAPRRVAPRPAPPPPQPAAPRPFFFPFFR